MSKIKFRFVEIPDKRYVDPKFMDADFCRQIMSGEPLPEGWAIVQFTGLHDKNGKEIWQGDVLKYTTRKRDYFVTFSFDTWAEEYLQKPVLPFTATLSEGEVIGNIYENPEILK